MGPGRLVPSVLTAAVALWLPDQLPLLPAPHLLERGREGQQELARSRCSPELDLGMGRL